PRDGGGGGLARPLRGRDPLRQQLVDARSRRGRARLHRAPPDGGVMACATVRCVPSPRLGRGLGCAGREQTGSADAPILRTWAVAPDGAQALAVWAWGSSLRAGPVSWRPCARVARLPTSRGSCARTVFRTPCDASSHERRLRVASSS